MDLYVCPSCRGRGFVRGLGGIYHECSWCDYKTQVQSPTGAPGFAEQVEAGVTCERCGRHDGEAATGIHLFLDGSELVIRLCGACFAALPVGKRTYDGWSP